MLPPPIVKITLGRVNCSEVGGRDEKFCCEYVECELVWSIQTKVSGRHLIMEAHGENRQRQSISKQVEAKYLRME